MTLKIMFEKSFIKSRYYKFFIKKKKCIQNFNWVQISKIIKAKNRMLEKYFICKKIIIINKNAGAIFGK